MIAFFVFLIVYVVVVGGGGAYLKWALRPVKVAFGIGKLVERRNAMRKAGTAP